MHLAPESLSWCSSSLAVYKRIDVYDNEPGAKYAAHGDRVLQHIRQHDRDPFAAR